MLRSLDCELESALLHLLQAEDKGKLYHYPPELVAKISLLKRAVYRVRREALQFRQENSVQAFREATNGANPLKGVGGESLGNTGGGQSAVAVAAAVKEQPPQGERASAVTPVAREVSPTSL